MKCDCEEKEGRIISLCSRHGALAEKYRTVAQHHPRGTAAPAAPADPAAPLTLREQLFLIVADRILEKSGAATPTDSVADKIVDITDAILRRHA